MKQITVRLSKPDRWFQVVRNRSCDSWGGLYLRIQSFFVSIF